MNFSNSILKPLSFSILLLMLLLPCGAGCKSDDRPNDEGVAEEIRQEQTPDAETSEELQAVMTLELDDGLAAMGLNPDLRPPLLYQFIGVESLNEDGVPITDPIAGLHELSWDFGDGNTERFTVSKSTQHMYREEGTYTASLFLRDSDGDIDTAQTTVNIGPAWLEIMHISTENRPDGRVNVAVTVRNQSNQILRVLQVDLLVGESPVPSNLSVTFGPGTVPEYLGPDDTYTLTGTVGQWDGELRARSSYCTPFQES